jgi:hypothetical protein
VPIAPLVPGRPYQVPNGAIGTNGTAAFEESQAHLRNGLPFESSTGCLHAAEALALQDTSGVLGRMPAARPMQRSWEFEKSARRFGS